MVMIEPIAAYFKLKCLDIRDQARGALYNKAIFKACSLRHWWRTIGLASQLNIDVSDTIYSAVDFLD